MGYKDSANQQRVLPSVRDIIDAAASLKKSIELFIHSAGSSMKRIVYWQNKGILF